MMPGWSEIMTGLFSMVLFVAFWAAVIYAIVALLRGRRSQDRSRSRAIEVLEERYARGEIERDEFLKRRAVLRGKPTRSTTADGP